MTIHFFDIGHVCRVQHSDRIFYQLRAEIFPVELIVANTSFFWWSRFFFFLLSIEQSFYLHLGIFTLPRPCLTTIRVARYLILMDTFVGTKTGTMCF